jgi:hypothetical protein
MRLIKWFFTVRNYFHVLWLRGLIRAIKILRFNFTLSKTGLLTLIFIVAFIFTGAGYAWRTLQERASFKRDVLYMLRYIAENEAAIDALKTRLADAEARHGQKVARNEKARKK